MSCGGRSNLTALPEITTPEDLAKRLGWSERRVRDVARRAGACRILGNRMVFTPSDVAAMEEIANGIVSQPQAASPQSYKSAHVYFFKQGEFVKIGWSNKWRQRLLTLQRATPHEIEALAVYRGGLKMERDLHAKFASLRVKLEWFRLGDEIRDYIEANKRKCLKDARNSQP